MIVTARNQKFVPLSKKKLVCSEQIRPVAEGLHSRSREMLETNHARSDVLLEVDEMLLPVATEKVAGVNRDRIVGFLLGISVGTAVGFFLRPPGDVAKSERP